MVRLLIENGADASSHLHRLSAKTVQHFIQLGGDVNARDERQRTPLHMALPLHLASLAPSSLSNGVVQTLILNGADVNASDVVVVVERRG
ncbi:hypothetical protein EDB84DRAFT_1483583, partial [Lactarius hengduanensis]